MTVQKPYRVMTLNDAGRLEHPTYQLRPLSREEIEDFIFAHNHAAKLYHEQELQALLDADVEVLRKARLRHCALAHELVSLIEASSSIDHHQRKESAMTKRCPRAKSDMTPCYVKDGELAVALSASEQRICVGCERGIELLLSTEEGSA